MSTDITKVCLQDNFLDELRQSKTTVAIYLANGIKLQGRIDSFDPNVVIIKNENATLQMIYKHAISTVMSAATITRNKDRTNFMDDKEDSSGNI